MHPSLRAASAAPTVDARGSNTRSRRIARSAFTTRALLAQVALCFLLIAGTAYITNPAPSSAQNISASPPSACQPGNVLGRARVTGSAQTPINDYNESSSFIIDRYTCTGSHATVGVKRLGLGQFAVRFPSNPAILAAVTAESSELNAAVSRIKPGEFRVTLRNHAGQLSYGAFHIVVV